MYNYTVKKVSDLIPYVNNSRTHSEEQTTQIASSISEFGFTNPVLIDENDNLIAGHGRLLAANKLGIKEVPAIILDGLTKAQKKAYVIADNQLALNSGWDLDTLRLEIEGLKELEFDVDLLGFDDNMLSSIYLDNENGETDADEEWQGMPEFDQQDATSFRKLIVHFESNEDAKAMLEIIGQKYTEKKKSIWFPYKPQDDLKSESYE
jgi:ParB-like chromosome segregation protein Spo0J